MLNRLRWVVMLTVWALSCGGHSGASGQGAKPVNKGHAMEPSSQNGVHLTAALKTEAGKPLLPEEAPIFEVHLRNDGAAPQTLTSISNSVYSPTVRLFDGAGKVLGTYTPISSGARTIGDVSTVRMPPPRTVTLQPGSEETRLINLWSYRDPVGPGSYSFDALHSTADGERLNSNVVPFAIVPAQVDDVVLSYDTAQRTNSILAWLARPLGNGGQDRLLVRTSGFVSHATAQVGATAVGEFPIGSHLAISSTPLDAMFSPGLGWVGVVSGDHVTLIEHNMSEPQWRAPQVGLPLTNAVPVPRFPNRQHAVFLATGSSSRGPALGGVVAEHGNSQPKQWVVQISKAPTHSACAFAMQGAITFLFSSDDGKTSRLHKIDVNEDGTIASPERVIRESPNTVLAIVADMRAAAPVSFVVLEGSRSERDEVAFAKINLLGEVQSTGLRKVAGWPTEDAAGGPRPANPVGLSFETDATGLPWIALIDQHGDLIGGRMDAAISPIRDKRLGPALFPQVAAIASSVTISSFNHDGTLFHNSGAEGQ